MLGVQLSGFLSFLAKLGCCCLERKCPSHNDQHMDSWAGTVTPSDQRLKDEVRDLPSEECLDVLRQVSAVSYRRNDLSESTRRIGFIAQNVEASLGPSIANTNVVDSIEREIAPGATQTLKTLAYDRMGVILWECTRSLLARIEMLEARVAQLSAPQ